jgi:transposase
LGLSLLRLVGLVWERHPPVGRVTNVGVLRQQNPGVWSAVAAGVVPSTTPNERDGNDHRRKHLCPDARGDAGIDTHADFHVAAAIDHNGGVLGVETFDTTTAGHRCLVRWLAGFGVLDKIGVEGTGSYGAGIARHLTAKAITVIEVDRPNRQARHRAGKSDAVDAIVAARAVLTGTATGTPKSRDGNIEAIRVLCVARRSGSSEWIQIINQMRHLCFTAPEEIRRRFDDLSPIMLVRTAAGHGHALAEPMSFVTRLC